MVTTTINDGDKRKVHFNYQTTTINDGDKRKFVRVNYQNSTINDGDKRKFVRVNYQINHRRQLTHLALTEA